MVLSLSIPNGEWSSRESMSSSNYISEEAASAAMSPAKAWLRALASTAPITLNPTRVFPVVVEELAERFGTTSALLSERECMTFRGIAERANRYARWALTQGLVKG